MAREIKFRAWDKRHNEWVLSIDAFDFIEPDSQSDKFWLSSTDDVVLMQFTGLLDKNGKEIYEGDIVNLISGGYSPFGVEVTYDETMCAFGFLGIRGYKIGWISIDKFLSGASIKQIEVIGNIWENPKLLNV